MKINVLTAIVSGLILSACAQEGPKINSTSSSRSNQIDPGTTQIQTINTAMPVGTPSLPVESLAYGPVTAVTEQPVNGVATVHYFKDGSAILGAQVNIDIPQDGFFYEAWLQTQDGSKSISIGHLANPFDDARHTVRFESKEDLKAYTQMMVSLEVDDGNPSRGEIVAKAILKPTSR